MASIFFRPITAARNARRFQEIANILARQGFGYVLDIAGLRPWPLRWFFRNRDSGRSAPERLRLVIEEIGPTAIKLGQVLSTRADFVPEVILDELSKLQDTVPPFPFSDVQATIFRELGQPLELLFDEFDRVPVAAASLSQVHRARLIDGRQVAVKVQRPEIERRIDTDIDILMTIAGTIERRTDWGRFYNLTETIEEFARVIREELDFRGEGRNAEQFSRIFEEDESIRIPRVHWALTTKRVLTLEWLEGIKILDIEQLEEAGIDRVSLAHRFARIILEQILIHGFFHADPHPGNVFVMRDGAVAFLDFGMVGYIDPTLKRRLVSLVLSLVGRDVDALSRGLLELGFVREQVDHQRLRSDLARLLRRYYNVPIRQIPIGEATRDTLELARRHTLQLPADLTLLGRAMMTMEGVALSLDPSVSIVSVAEPFGRRLMSERVSFSKNREELTRGILEMASLARQLPRRLEGVLDKIEKGTISVEIEDRNRDLPQLSFELAANRLALALIVVAGVLGSVFLLGMERGPVILATGVISLALTIFLSFWIVVAIIRSA